MLSSLLAAFVIILFQTGEEYSNLDLTDMKYNKTKLSIVEKE
jgi:hypothetical protein